MDVRRLPLPPLGANCYLLSQGGQAALIDPGDGGEQTLSTIAHLLVDGGLTLRYILLTHGHFDHVGGLRALMAAWPDAQVCLHPADFPGPDRELFPLSAPAGAKLLAEGDVLDLSGLSIRVLHTPGHSQGSVCFLAGDALFTGDTLFRFSMGRTDFPGGDAGQMTASLKRLAALEGDYTVYPGHDAPTTLDQERGRNPYLQNLPA